MNSQKFVMTDVERNVRSLLRQPHVANVPFVAKAVNNIRNDAFARRIRSPNKAIRTLRTVELAAEAFYGALLCNPDILSRAKDKFGVISASESNQRTQSYGRAYISYPASGTDFISRLYDDDKMAIQLANYYGCRPGVESEEARVLEIMYHILNPKRMVRPKRKQHSVFMGDAPNSANRQPQIAVGGQQSGYKVSLRKIDPTIDVVATTFEYCDRLHRMYIGETPTGEFVPFRRAIFRFFRQDKTLTEAVVQDADALYYVVRLQRDSKAKRDVYHVAQVGDVVLDAHTFSDIVSGIHEGRIRFFSNDRYNRCSVLDMLNSLMPDEDALILAYRSAAYKIDHVD